jgi:PEP-CTERM motif
MQYFIKIKKEERRRPMKIGKFIICAILILALTNYAYGLGKGSHHHHRNSGGDVATFQAFDNQNSEENGTTGDSAPVSVPEPSTMLLLGAGLIGLGAYVRRKFKK